MGQKYEHKSSVRVYARLLTYVRQYWIAFFLAIIGNVLYSGVDSGFTYLLKPILNKGFIARDMHFINILPFLIFGAFIVRGVSNFIANYCMARVSTGIVMDFRQKIFKHIQRLPATYFDNTSSGKILSALLYNVGQVSTASSTAITTFVQSGCMIVGLLIVMFSISWRLSLLFLVTAPVISLAVRISSRRLRHINRSLQDQMGDVTNIAEEGIIGYQVIRGFGGQAYETKKFDKAVKRNRQRELKTIVTRTVAVSSIQVVASIALCVTVYLATSHKTTTVLSAGGFVSMITAMLALLKPLKNFTRINATVQKGLAGAQSIFELIDEPVEQDEGTYQIDKVKGEIICQDVSFSYPGTRKEVLSDINFKVSPGEIIALVGHSGGGKTTLVNVLQRLYHGAQGVITLDGVDINDYQLTNYRNQFASVSQHVILFNDTIRHNIAYGSFSNVSDATVISAAKAANAWDFIQELPEGLNTLVGENGVLLSGGQRQRLAIARAILKDAPILVLDEATSALDTESEKQIRVALDELMHHHTTIVIAHRLSTIEHANKIIVMEHGRIVEFGTHEELLAKDAHYAKLYKLQFRGD